MKNFQWAGTKFSAREGDAKPGERAQVTPVDRDGPGKFGKEGVEGIKLKKRVENTYPPGYPGAEVPAAYMEGLAELCGGFGAVFPAESLHLLPSAALERRCLPVLSETTNCERTICDKRRSLKRRIIHFWSK